MAQLVARDIRDVEAAGSSPATLTINHYLGVAQLVAHTVWDREVAGSSPVTQTIFVILSGGLWRIIYRSRGT